MPAAGRILELLDDVLGRRPADAALVAALVREKVPEGLYLEYKRGKWFSADRAQDLRSYVSGFSNAEGGVLIIGIVGGEDSQGADKWSFEGPVCPAEGWDAWLGRVLKSVSPKARVEWQIVRVDEIEVLLIAANRAEELIRVYEKPRLICYLRVGDQTIPIDETLFADLALGRRAKPDLALEQFVMDGTTDSIGFHLNLALVVHNQGLLWIPDLRVFWIGYARTGSGAGAAASASLKRELDLRPTGRSDIVPVVGEFNFWTAGRNGGTWRSPEGSSIEVKPFELTKFGTQVRGHPVTNQAGPWAWYSGIMVLPKNGSPLWAQLAIQGNVAGPYSTSATSLMAWALTPGIPPIVAWFDGAEAPLSFKALFGDRQ